MAEASGDLQVHPGCVLGERVVVGKGVRLGPFVVVGDDAVLGDGACLESSVVVGRGVRIGAGAHLEAGCVLREGVEIGARVRVGSGAVLGADGFGFVQDGGTHHKIPQVGTVILEDDVQVAALACIDRATVGATRIGRGSVVGALSQVAHNVVVAPACSLGAQAGLAGSSRLGEGVHLEPGAGVAPHVTVGAATVVGFRAGVIKHVGEGLHLEGFPARPQGEMAALEAVLPQVAGLAARLARLETQVAAGVPDSTASLTSCTDPSQGEAR